LNYSIEISEISLNDLDETVEYISETLQNEIAAENLYKEFYKKSYSLVTNPMHYALVKDEYLAQKGVRLMTVNNYNIFYVVRENINVVRIIRFMHSRRNWLNILQESKREVFL
jgi:toxin ParE1/3/4